MTFFSDLLVASNLTEVRNLVLGYASSAGLAITNWAVGGVGQQTFEAVAAGVQAFSSVVAQVTRGFASLDTSTDPGDYDAYDSTNQSKSPDVGFLSSFGHNTFGTERAEMTFASGTFTLTNAGSVARTFSPGGLSFQRSTASSDGSYPTYYNVEDATVYTNPDGSVSVAAGASVSFPIQAYEAGTKSNAPSSTITLTSSLLGCSGTNPDPVLGTDREDADVYRERCRQASARLSFGGPEDAITYLAAKNLDGTPLTNSLGNIVNINRAQVIGSAGTGIVTAYYAAPSGEPVEDDVIAANNNIMTNAYAVPDAITFVGEAATEQSLSVQGTARVRASSGVSTATLAALAAAAVEEYAASIPIGGVDRVAGAGVLYTRDLEDAVRRAVPSLYAVQVTSPSGASTAVSAGQVVVISSTSSDWTVTAV
jgi:hypothetical protein